MRGVASVVKGPDAGARNGSTAIAYSGAVPSSTAVRSGPSDYSTQEIATWKSY